MTTRWQIGPPSNDYEGWVLFQIGIPGTMDEDDFTVGLIQGGNRPILDWEWTLTQYLPSQIMRWLPMKDLLSLIENGE
jgi:hypothetical protein